MSTMDLKPLYEMFVIGAGKLPRRVVDHDVEGAVSVEDAGDHPLHRIGVEGLAHPCDPTATAPLRALQDCSR